MRQALAACAVLVAMGCGSSGGDGPAEGMGAGNDPALAGDWVATLANSCVVGFNFSGSKFTFATICPDSPAYDEQETKGAWLTSGDTLQLNASDSTCSDMTTLNYETYSVSSGQFSMSDSSGTLAFVRNTSPPGSGATTFGCFRNGTFAPSPLASVQ